MKTAGYETSLVTFGRAGVGNMVIAGRISAAGCRERRQGKFLNVSERLAGEFFVKSEACPSLVAPQASDPRISLHLKYQLLSLI